MSDGPRPATAVFPVVFTSDRLLIPGAAVRSVHPVLEPAAIGAIDLRDREYKVMMFASSIDTSDAEHPAIRCRCYRDDKSGRC